MPTVLRLDGVRVVIYPNDHAPAHVRVIGADAEAVFVLNCPAGPVGLRESYRFSAAALRSIAASLGAALETLCRSWEAIHGDH